MIAAAFLDTLALGQARRYHVCLYDAVRGEEFMRLPIRVDGSLAVSPGGRMLATGERILHDAESMDMQMNVNLHSVADSRVIARLVHERWKIGRGQYPAFGLLPDTGLVFTSDGRHLITSGLHTRIWRIAAESPKQ